MPAGDRAVAHAAAAELLKSRGASPERVALQLLHVEPAGSPVIVEDLRAAAAVARGRGAATTEVTLLARALCEPPTPEVRLPLLLDLAQCEYATGRTADAAGHYDEARRNAKDPVTQARALIGLFQSRSGEFSAQRAMAADLEAALPTVLETDRELGLLVWTLLLLAVEPGRGWQRVASGVEGLRGDTPGEALLVGHAMLPIVNPTVTAAELSVVSAQAERHAAALVERGATSLVMTGIVLGLLWTDDCRQAERLLTDAADIAQRHGALQDLALIYQFLAICRLRDGRLLDAEADARTAAAISVGEGWAGAGTRAAAPLAHSLLDQGRVEDARRELADLGDGRIPDAPAMTTVLIARMRLRSALGRHGAALDDWTEALARAERHFGGVNSSWVPDLLIAAEVHHAAGETRERDALVGRASELAEQWGTPGFRGAVRSRLARFGRREDAIALSAEGIELLRTSPARLELATALVAHGQLLRRAGQPSDSRDPLREGYELARLCGAQPLAETARTELRASGVRLRREALTGVDSLTASERRVADLAARGLSNAEIAQRQFLTVKTIEGHLSRAYRKLDISNRADLPRALTGKDKGDGQGSSP
jgi:DNA-binding CsgD family transcriptional regulator